MDNKQINNIVDQLFTNGSNEKADRLLLIQEDASGAAKVSNARYLGGFSRQAVLDIIARAVNSNQEGE